MSLASDLRSARVGLVGDIIIVALGCVVEGEMGWERWWLFEVGGGWGARLELPFGRDCHMQMYPMYCGALNREAINDSRREENGMNCRIQCRDGALELRLWYSHSSCIACLAANAGTCPALSVGGIQSPCSPIQQCLNHIRPQLHLAEGPNVCHAG